MRKYISILILLASAAVHTACNESTVTMDDSVDVRVDSSHEGLSGTARRSRIRLVRRHRDQQGILPFLDGFRRQQHGNDVHRQPRLSGTQRHPAHLDLHVPRLPASGAHVRHLQLPPHHQRPQRCDQRRYGQPGTENRFRIRDRRGDGRRVHHDGPHQPHQGHADTCHGGRDAGREAGSVAGGAAQCALLQAEPLLLHGRQRTDRRRETQHPHGHGSSTK